MGSPTLQIKQHISKYMLTKRKYKYSGNNYYNQFHKCEGPSHDSAFLSRDHDAEEDQEVLTFLNRNSMQMKSLGSLPKQTSLPCYVPEL